MKILKLLLPASITIGVLAVTGCSQTDEPSGDLAIDDNAIRFAANTELSRSGDITTNNLRSFNVYAYTGSDKTIYMDNVTVTKTGTNAWTYSPLRYWPAGETVDFYAFAPASWVASSGPLAPVPYDCTTATEDIIYAVNPGLSGFSGSANAQIVFNFRHALSKVTLLMRSSNDGIVVKVSNVALVNILRKGNFNFPAKSTTGGVTDGNLGTWSDLSVETVYPYHISQDANDLITLSTTPTNMEDTGMGLGGGKFLLPQPLTWRSNGRGNDNYITVMCSVYDATTGTKLWPNANTPEENIVAGSTFGDGLLKFPLLTSTFSAWLPGYHYTYNLTINGNEEMGVIEFGNPTVDTFVDVTADFE